MMMGGDEGERETGKRIGVSGVTLASSLWKLEFAANQSPDSSPPWQMLPLFDIIFALRTYLSFISITSKNLLPLLLGYSPQGFVQFLSASCLRASENSPPSPPRIFLKPAPPPPLQPPKHLSIPSPLFSLHHNHGSRSRKECLPGEYPL